MKKVYQSRGQRKHSHARARSEASRRATHAARLYRRRNDFGPYKKPKKLRPVDRKQWYALKAPENFSLINNHEEILKYFHEARTIIRNRHQVRFDLSDISTLSPDAIALLIAHVQDSNFNRGINIRGVSPRDPELAKIFTLSGFYDHVSTSLPIAKNSSHMLLHRVTNTKVENDIAKRAAMMAVNHTFRDERKFRPVYEILIEAMANTNNHAGEYAGMYDWWIFIYNHPDEPRTTFSFVDLGVGIFESLPVQTYLRRFASAFGITNNATLVPKLFAGEISSRTGLPERGKGLPLIYSHSKNERFQSFKIIANDVYSDLKSGVSLSMATPLQGTFLSFELAQGQVGAATNE